MNNNMNKSDKIWRYINRFLHNDVQINYVHKLSVTDDWMSNKLDEANFKDIEETLSLPNSNILKKPFINTNNLHIMRKVIVRSDDILIKKFHLEWFTKISTFCMTIVDIHRVYLYVSSWLSSTARGSGFYVFFSRKLVL
ncbi:hypothetical protein RF11_05424 [Thelohanellus kitauei]|uniref:Uncharacterized protein n=1 Tax=Thelohanellus kitauei TaxID=669202 RepID=A0A0C2MWI2_THEKT|nr:hypothetical protein RF11_05424 [Thelohanellus kitauei]